MNGEYHWIITIQAPVPGSVMTATHSGTVTASGRMRSMIYQELLNTIVEEVRKGDPRLIAEPNVLFFSLEPEEIP
jgi:hypothetical protein